MTGLLVRGGSCVTAQAEFRADLRCRDGRIVEVAEGLEPAGEEIVDAGGLLVMPGGVDPHVHLSLPVAGTVSSDDFESGTTAAVAGGTTTIVDFVHPERGQSMIEAFEERRREAAEAVCDHGFHMAVTWWGEESARQMAQAIDAGMPSFKVYLAYKATVGLDDRDLVEVLRAAADLDGLVIAHAEHGEMVEQLRDRFVAAGHTEPLWHALSRPPELEGEATNRIAVLAGVAGTRLYVVHVTCRESVEAIARAQRKGWRVSGETCPQYLLLDDSVYRKPGFEAAPYVIAPPIRSKEHQRVLWQALDDGTLELVATDHCPFDLEGQKELGRDDFRLIPGGAAGVEHRLALLWTHGVASGRFDARRFVELVSTRPAQRFGCFPRKGSLEVGADADLVLWDPRATATISASTHHHRCDTSIYEGFEVRGQPAVVAVGGRVAYRDGDLGVEPGTGRFLERRLERRLERAAP